MQAAGAHGIDTAVLRAAEGPARRAVGLGHGAVGLSRMAEGPGRRCGGAGTEVRPG
ncbi:hypothetical protein ACFWN1_24725 [Streptomyces sp. NPDC058459]|uniref:imine reductase family protein n=1 Tax=Streptomyces sp. NPDC058459 TaxID=3346508 RepID=UPI00365F063D